MEDLKCYFCEIALAITTKYSEPSCEQCKADEYRQIENPDIASKRTDEQNAKRQKMMKLAFDHAFNECWYCENEISTSIKFGEKICDTCNEKGKEYEHLHLYILWTNAKKQHI